MENKKINMRQMESEETSAALIHLIGVLIKNGADTMEIVLEMEGHVPNIKVKIHIDLETKKNE